MERNLQEIRLITAFVMTENETPVVSFVGWKHEPV